LKEIEESIVAYSYLSPAEDLAEARLVVCDLFSNFQKVSSAEIIGRFGNDDLEID